MAQSSIHFNAVKPSSEAHNERLVVLDYVFAELSLHNDSWKQDTVSNRTITIAAHCKAVSGRKLQRNAIPIREAVVNLEKRHSMADVMGLAKVLEAHHKISCFQIHIHRDEGKDRQSINYHAHLLFDWQNKETGTMLRFNRADLSHIQDTVSEQLSMERGVLRVNSNRKRLEAVAYKRQEEERRLKKLQGEIATLEQKKNLAARQYQDLKEKYYQLTKPASAANHAKQNGGRKSRKNTNATKSEPSSLDQAVQQQYQCIKGKDGEIAEAQRAIQQLARERGELPAAAMVESIKKEINQVEQAIREIKS
ncbi:MAG: hypothetical protein WBA23_00805 [Tunicatimonas sp.]|uniref:hypothetical protein n=1 Tax=Tunicatimonas sp. TaxID=1940096 RepID=UPI003C7447E2